MSLSLFGWHEVAQWLAERPLPLPHLAEPLWLLALLAPIGLWALAGWQRQRVARYADAALRPWTEVLPNPTGNRTRRRLAVLFGLFWLFAVLALADPRVPKSSAPPSEIRPPVLFLLDTTAAMQVEDVSPDRLRRTQTLVAQLVHALPDRRLGLMIARDQPGLILPPATDRQLLDAYLTDWPKLARPLAAQNAAAALDWAAKLPMMPGGAVVWLTAADQADFTGDRGTALLAAAEALRRAHIQLIALTVAGQGGVLQDHGLPIKTADDTPITSTPAPERVAELAQLTGGSARVTGRLADDVRFITQAVDQLPNLSPSSPAAADTRPLFALPLTLAMFFFAAALFLGLAPRRRMPNDTAAALGLSLAVLLATAVTPPRAEAGSLWHDEAENAARLAAAQHALAQGNFARAQVDFAAAQGFEARLGTGIAAFRRADYAFAVNQLQQALLLATAPSQLAEARYNLGLALTLAGRLADARDAFAAVAEQAGLPHRLTADALENQQIVEQLLQTAAKNSANSPKFQGHQIATYGYYQEPTQSRFDKTIQKSDAAISGNGASTDHTPAAQRTPFVLNAATETSARAKLNLIENHPAPLLDSLLRQQPYHLTPTGVQGSPTNGATP